MFVNSDFSDLLKFFNHNHVKYLILGGDTMSTQITLTLSDELYEHAKRWAGTHQSELHVEKSIDCQI